LGITPSSGTLTTNHEKTMQTENQTSKHEDSPKQEAGEGCSGATCSASDPYEREAAKAAIHTLQRELARCKEECVNLREERDEAIRMREWDNRAISIARHYGHDDSSREMEDGRIRPALVLEKAVAVAIDGWVDGNSVTIQLCREEVEQWVALVYVHGQDVTAFSADEMGLCEDVQEVWMSSAVLAALDHARALPAESESLPNAGSDLPPPSQLESKQDATGG
jgi:hypothetical protein